MNTITGTRLLLATALAYLLLAGYPVFQEAWIVSEAQADSATRYKILQAAQNTNVLLERVLTELREIKVVLKERNTP